MALPFDTLRLAPAGDAFAVAQKVGEVAGWTSGPGLLAYISGQGTKRQYVWQDRNGKNHGVAGDGDKVVGISPDGTRLVGDYNKGIHVLNFAEDRPLKSLSDAAARIPRGLPMPAISLLAV